MSLPSSIPSSSSSSMDIIDLSVTNTNKLIKVRFNSGVPNNGRVYLQPLFYLAENYKHGILAKDSSDNIHIDKDLNLHTDKINLETYNFIGTNNDTKIFYILNQSNNEIHFQYKNVKMCLKTEERKDLTEKLYYLHRDDVLIYSSFIIEYPESEFNIFEDFIKASIIYYTKYYNDDKEDRNKISIYLTSSEGNHFQYLGKRNKRKIESIYLPKKQKDDILADITKFLDQTTRDRYLRLGINHKRVYLLEGVPGTGKTSLITALASNFNFNIAIVSFVPKMTDVDLLRILRSINDTHDENYNKIEKQSILVFEDIDCIFKERKSHDENRNGITFSGLLNALDGITSNENLICFITTNYKNNLDSALLRPGRVDYIMRFDYSTKEQVQDMFRDFTDCKDSDLPSKFYNSCCALRIKMTTSLLQQYLLKYIDDVDGALKNIEEMKKMFDSSKVDKEADESNLYH